MDSRRFILILVVCGVASAIVCKKDKFTCQNQKKCINIYWFCDGDNDCGDGSDDTVRNKSIEQSGIPCRRSQRVCMLPDYILSKKDQICTKNPECEDDEFACADGSACLTSSYFCDNDKECKDGSDEILRNYSDPESLKGFACRRGSDICMLPRDRANLRAALCELNPDCNDDEFMCSDGTRCIPLTDFCDGNKDCDDGSDEVKASTLEGGQPCRQNKHICLLPERYSSKRNKICKKDITCDKNQFRCADGNECIDAQNFCDGVENCDDGSDEILRDLTLDSNQPGVPCRRTRKICMFPANYDLVQRKNICKAKNECDNDEFACMDGSDCISASQYCDGIRNCRDGSDEILFDITSPITGTKCRRQEHICILPLSQANKTATLCKKKTTCADNEFACLDGKQCLPKAKFCDGSAHCKDGSDEIKSFHADANVTGVRCRQTKFTCLLHDNETSKEDKFCKKEPICGPNEFACSDNLQCLPKKKFCDGVVDCRDGSDELKRNRSEIKTLDAVPCRQNDHVCWLPKSQVAKRSSICQKVPKCGKGEFACSDGTMCLEIEAFCNNSMECPDGSDEMHEGSNNPAAKGGSRCRRDQYKCILPASQKSKRSDICKKAYECTDKEFACSDNSQCIRSWWFCDGYTDCADGSDELSPSSGKDGMPCRRDQDVCLLPTNQISKKLSFCRRRVP